MRQTAQPVFQLLLEKEMEGIGLSDVLGHRYIVTKKKKMLN